VAETELYRSRCFSVGQLCGHAEDSAGNSWAGIRPIFLA